MTVELIAAPPACGKTRACLQRIVSLRAHQPLAKIRVVVPDRLQAADYRRRLAAAGGALNTAVGTFGDLYQVILRCSGRELPLASPLLARRILQTVAAEAHTRGELPYYGAICHTPGFYAVVGEAFTELKRALVYPQQLTSYAREGPPALREIALLYSRYIMRLQALGWADEEGLSWLAVEALQATDCTADGLRLLVFDGFDTYSGSQCQALRILAEQVSEIIITLPLAPGSRRAAERRFQPIYDKLVSELAPRITLLDPRAHLPADLQHLASSIFVRGARPLQHAEQCLLLQARSPAEEAREALRWFKALVRRRDITLGRCALFVPDLALYRPALAAAAHEFGVPLAFSEYASLARSPAVAALVSLLQLAARDYPARDLLATLRSPYVACGLAAGDIDALETIAQAGRIVEGREQWQETFALLADTLVTAENDLDPEQRLPTLPRGPDAARLHKALDAFLALITPPKTRQSCGAWLGWLEGLLQRSAFFERADPERDAPACEGLRELLRAMALAEQVAGQQQMPYTDFAADFIGLLESAPAREATDPAQEALYIGRLYAARGARFDAVALLGLSEGIFPAVERPDPFLDEDLRQTLGLEPRLEREQAGLFYQALARADGYVLLTRPYLADGGEAWEESPYWQAVARLLPEASVRTVRPDDPIPLEQAASAQELLFLGVRRGAITQRYAELTAPFLQLQKARSVLQARRNSKADGPYEGEVGDLASELAQRYPRSAPWSASRLETYATCPYFYYVNRMLDLEVRAAPQAGYDAAQLGSILHSILEQLYRAAQDPCDMNELEALLLPITEQVFERAPRQYGFRPTVLWQAEQQELREMLKNTLSAMAEVNRGWTPIGFECTFGQGETPALRIDLPDEFILLRGTIDRVDRDVQGRIRVIDYKTGGSHLAAGDLQSGRRLQLPLYALAARDALGLGQAEEGFYWQIRQAQKSSLKLETYTAPDGQGVDAACRTFYRHLERILDGIRRADFRPVPPAGGCPAYCPAGLWCWRYAEGW